MEKELAAEVPGAIEIVGVNAAGQESGNALMVDGRALPWLQDTDAVNAWAAWQVTWRDVIIVGAASERRGVYNLTEHDLNVPASYAALKQLLLDAR